MTRLRIISHEQLILEGMRDKGGSCETRLREAIRIKRGEACENRFLWFIWIMEAKGSGAGKELNIATYQERSRVVAEASDTGMGVPEGMREKIFVPFLTTKR